MTPKQIIYGIMAAVDDDMTSEFATDRLLEELQKGGFVIVPKLPSIAMFEAAWAEAQKIAREAGGSVDKSRVIDCCDRYYQTMITAAVVQEELREMKVILSKGWYRS